PTGSEKRHQRLHILFSDGTPICQARHPGEDLLGTRALFGYGPRLANENCTATRRILCGPSRVVWTADLQHTDIGIVHVDLIVRDDAPSLLGLRKAFGFPQLAYKRDTDDVRTCLNRHAQLESSISTDLHVLFPGIIAGKI